MNECAYEWVISHIWMCAHMDFAGTVSKGNHIDCHIWMRHVAFEWARIWMSHVAHECAHIWALQSRSVSKGSIRVRAHMNASCHIWMRAHMNGSCHTWMCAHMNASCHIWMSAHMKESCHTWMRDNMLAAYHTDPCCSVCYSVCCGIVAVFATWETPICLTIPGELRISGRWRMCSVYLVFCSVCWISTPNMFSFVCASRLCVSLIHMCHSFFNVSHTATHIDTYRLTYTA